MCTNKTQTVSEKGVLPILKAVFFIALLVPPWLIDHLFFNINKVMRCQSFSELLQS